MGKPVFDKKLFWDVIHDSNDIDKYPQFTIIRIFERGTVDDVKKIRRYFGDRKIKEEIVKAKWIEPETLQFLSAIYNIPLNKFKCYIQKQLRSPHSIY